MQESSCCFGSAERQLHIARQGGSVGVGDVRLDDRNKVPPTAGCNSQNRKRHGWDRGRPQHYAGQARSAKLAVQNPRRNQAQPPAAGKRERENPNAVDNHPERDQHIEHAPAAAATQDLRARRPRRSTSGKVQLNVLLKKEAATNEASERRWSSWL